VSPVLAASTAGVPLSLDAKIKLLLLNTITMQSTIANILLFILLFMASSFCFVQSTFYQFNQFQSTSELLLLIFIHPGNGSLPGGVLPVVNIQQERSTSSSNGILHNPSCLLHLYHHDRYSL